MSSCFSALLSANRFVGTIHASAKVTVTIPNLVFFIDVSGVRHNWIGADGDALCRRGTGPPTTVYDRQLVEGDIPSRGPSMRRPALPQTWYRRAKIEGLDKIVRALTS